MVVLSLVGKGCCRWLVVIYREEIEKYNLKLYVSKEEINY